MRMREEVEEVGEELIVGEAMNLLQRELDMKNNIHFKGSLQSMKCLSLEAMKVLTIIQQTAEVIKNHYNHYKEYYDNNKGQ